MVVLTQLFYYITVSPIWALCQWLLAALAVRIELNFRPLARHSCNLFRFATDNFDNIFLLISPQKIDYTYYYIFAILYSIYTLQKLEVFNKVYWDHEDDKRLACFTTLPSPSLICGPTCHVPMVLAFLLMSQSIFDDEADRTLAPRRGREWISRHYTWANVNPRVGFSTLKGRIPKSIIASWLNINIWILCWFHSPTRTILSSSDTFFLDARDSRYNFIKTKTESN